MCRPTWHRFFGQWRDIGMMTDDSHHGEGEHDQRDMAVPAVPGTAFVVIEAEFVFGGFETVLDGPAMAQRWPSTRTSFFMGVPVGHQVEKKARSPSAILRRINRPRVHSPERVLLYSLASRSASSR